jgi:hypothetical protein
MSDINEVSPPGWSGSVKAMKKHKKDIDNPYALAWHMKKKGDKPHYKPEEDSKKEPKKKEKYKNESSFESFEEFLARKELNENEKWIQKAINPKHKNYCTPMTKKTCTPKRKALAMRFKKGDIHKDNENKYKDKD